MIKTKKQFSVDESMLIEKYAKLSSENIGSIEKDIIHQCIYDPEFCMPYYPRILRLMVLDIIALFGIEKFDIIQKNKILDIADSLSEIDGFLTPKISNSNTHLYVAVVTIWLSYYTCYKHTVSLIDLSKQTDELRSVKKCAQDAICGEFLNRHFGLSNSKRKKIEKYMTLVIQGRRKAWDLMDKGVVNNDGIIALLSIMDYLDLEYRHPHTINGHIFHYYNKRTRNV